MPRPSRWTLAPASPHAAKLARDAGIATITAQLLLNRGIDDPARAAEFLRPTLLQLHDPELLPGAADAADQLAQAIRDRLPIAVFGDYDVDGITAAAILYHALRKLGGTVSTYIPHRIDEGYGLGEPAVHTLAGQGARVLVTVDCGITAHGPVAAAKRLGMSVIVTDHHEPRYGPGGGWELPEADCIVHPRLPTSGPAYPNPHLCGSGVAFKLAWAVGKAMHGSRVAAEFRELLVEMTALATLGTIADVVPLRGENRSLAASGLGCIRKSALIGIRALLESAGFREGRIDSEKVGFQLAPRLNAAGRMGHANLALEMLTTDDPARAGEIAAYLETQNRQRQALQRKTVDTVLEEIQRIGDDRDDRHAVVAAGKGWHPGIIGIVASRIVETLHKPALLLALPEEESEAALLAGSGRSIPGFHLAGALAECSELLASHGGHEMAAGLKLRAGNFPAFRERFQAIARSRIPPEHLTRELHLDCEAGLGALTQALVAELHRLAPFGNGNRPPLLLCRAAQLAQAPRRMGKTGDHAQLMLRQNRTVLRAVAFGQGHLADSLAAGQTIDVAFEPQVSEWNGGREVQVMVREVRA